MNESEFAELYCTVAHNNCEGYGDKAYGFWAQQNPHDLWALIKEVSKIEPKHILELGVNHGGSTVFWDHIAGSEGKVVGVDIGGFQGHCFSMFREEFCSYEPVSNLLLVPGDSHDLAVFDQVNEFLAGRVDFLFMDGDHSYEGLKQDFEMYGSLVPAGGVIAVPSVQEESVATFWAELTAPRSITSPRDKRIGIIKK